MHLIAGSVLTGLSLLALTVLTVQPGPMRLSRFLLLILLLAGVVGGVFMMFLPRDTE